MNVRGVGPYGWMLCGSLSFSFMATMSHALADRCDWQIVVLARAGLVALFAALLARGAGVPLVFWGPPILWVRSLAGSASMMLFFFALTRPHVPTGYVLTLTNLFPVWVALLCWPMLREAPPRSVWVAVVCGVLGVAVMKLPSELPDAGLATWAALCASLFTAVAMLGLHKLRGIAPLAIVVHFSTVATLTAVLCFFLFDLSRPVAESLNTTAVLLLLGVGVTATVGQWCLTRAFAAGDPSRVSVVGLSQVVFVMVLELFGGRVPEPTSLLGTVLVLAPTAWLMVSRKEDLIHHDPTGIQS